MGSARLGARRHFNPQPYRCFLVRCRLEAGAGPQDEAVCGGPGAWRFTVQQADRDATRHSFASLQDVAAYLEAELAATAAFGEVKPEDDLPNRPPGPEEAVRPETHGRPGATPRAQED